MTKEIIDFLQLQGESLYQAWERFKELQRNCPHHHLGREHLISIFYNGTNERTRATIDAASGGSLMKKTYDEANNLLEELATNSCSWSTERLRQPPQKGIMTLEKIQEFEAMKAKNATFLAQFEMNKQKLIKGMLNLRQGNDPYSNTYNLGWRNHPNFHGETIRVKPMPTQTWEEKFFKGETVVHPTKATSTTIDHNILPVFSKIGMRMKGEKLTSLLRKLEPVLRAKLPSITISRHKSLNLPSRFKRELKVVYHLQRNQIQGSKECNTSTNEEEVTELPYVKPPPRPPFVQKVPFPGRLKKTPDNQKFHKFLEIFKKLQINISFADALREMPQYAKFLKEIITKKRSWDDKGTISDLPTKLKDPRSFTIP
ncbi:uncharacterized protein LOC126687733 [Mercurialis annua]|uniref:uncharacterized protein LOC126687733 n=1 Tax=Mercurialis annua TaxID=3986 RepID=UPI00215E9C56|nr:uncharacterized protein LOC126687733 [Mercurialis annua]